MEWVWVISPVNGMPHRLPNNPMVIASFEARGYEVTDLPGELTADDPEFIELLEAMQPEEEEEATEAESAESEKEVE